MRWSAFDVFSTFRTGALALLTTLWVLLPAAAMATDVSGNINVSTTWTLAQSPYDVLTDVTVIDGVTLTIEPGVQVRFSNASANDNELIVNGTLNAVGTAALPIRFEGAVTTSSNYWEGIVTGPAAVMNLQHAFIGNTDFGLELNTTPTANLTVRDVVIDKFRNTAITTTAATGTLDLTRVTVRGTGVGTGVVTSAAALTVTDCSFLDVNQGVDLNNASATVTGTIFRPAANGTGLDVYRTLAGTSTVSIAYSTFWGGSYAVQFGKSSTSSTLTTTVSINRSIMEGQTLAHTYDFGRGSFGTISSLAVTQSVYSGPSTPFSQTTPSPETNNLRYRSLLVDPTNGNFAPTNRSPARYFSPADGTLVAGAVDYTGALTGAGLHGFWYENATFESGSVNDVAGDMVIAPGAVLTFRPDATLRMATTDNMQGGVDLARVEIRIEGRLNSDGTLSRPVRFTSGAASPARNNWYGVIVPSTAELASIRELDISWARVGMTVENRNLAMGNSNIHDCGVAGLLVEGGTPSFDGVNLYNNLVGARITNSASVSFTDVDAYNNTSIGVDLPSGSVTWQTGRVFGNGESGIFSAPNLNGSFSIYLEQLTIANNTGDGIWTNRGTTSSSRTLSLTTRACSITNNTGSGYRDNSSGAGSAVWSCQFSNLWQNSPNTSGITDSGTTCFSWNPLYVDGAARDYTPTQNSPLRGLGPSAGRVGALDYSGALGPQIMGFIWEDTVFTAAGSPYTLLGDLVVTAGRRVTFEPGVQFRVAPNTDGMIGGLSTNRAELRFLKDALFTFPTDGPAVVFTPNSTSPTAGMWWGTRFEDTIGSVEWLRVEYPQFGFNVVGPRSPTFEDVEVRYGTTNGFLIQNVTSSTNFADILAATLIGTNFAGSSRGVEATSSIVRLRSSYATHWGFGYFANATTVSTTAASHTLTNNTFVAQSYGVYANRSSSSTSYAQSLSLQNNLIANSTTGAIYDQNVAVGSGYNSAFTLLYNGYHNLATITVASGTTNTGPVTTNPNIEDDDWAAFPRWWDGQVFRTSPVINVGSPTAPSGLTRDLFGRARVLSSRVDIGAIEHDFTANQEPRADAVARSIVAPTGERVTLDGSAAVDLDGTIATAFWTMSDGTVTAGQTVQHTFATRGNAEAFITIVDDDGAPDHARVLVNVNDRPFAEANGPYFADVSTATVEEPVAFRSDNSSDTETAAASLTYVWNFGDGTPPVTGRNPLHPYTTAGLFIATLTVTDAAGLSATDTAVVEISGGAADTQGPLLQHTEIADGRPAGTPITVNVTAQDQTGVQSVTLFYRTIGTIPADEIELTRGAGTNWSGVIPGTAISAPGIEYWFSATDTTPAGNTTRLPVSASTFFNFTVSGDFVPPVITHTEVGDGQAPGSPVTVTATITDTTGVGVANLYYGSLSGSYASVTMTNVAGNTWSAQVPAVIVNPPGVKYYIEAIDTSPTPNRGVLPSGAPTTFFDFTVSSGDTTPPLIALTPVADNRPAGTAVTVNASIVDASGTVSSAAIYYRPAGSTGAYTQVAMTRGTGSSWSGVIPAAAVTTPGVQYYVTGTDPAGNVGTEPSGAPATPLSFTVVTADTTAPTIVHTPIANGQSPGVAVVIEATITDASPLQTVRVHYKRSTSSSAPPWPAVDMTLVSGNLYRAEIPDFAVNTPAMFYYIRAIDSAGNTALLPTTSTTTPYQFSVGTSDVTGPTLTVTPVADARTAGTAVTVTATATDTSGIGSVTLYYRTTGGGTYTSVVMASTGGTGYSGTIPAGAIVAPGVDYYVVATDAATVPNSTTSPATAPGTPSSFTVITPDVTAPTITITPVSPNRPAATEVTVSATITDATGVASARLFYRATGGTAFTQVSMTNTAGTTWSATIPAGAVTAPGVDYYVTATDSAAAANTATAPSTAPGTPLSFTVTPADTQAPVITHTLVTSVTYGEVISLSTTITDNVGVTSAQVFISIDAINWTPYSLSRGLGDAWGTTFLTSLIPSGTPSVYYYLSADDAAGNRSFLPAPGILGPQVVTINYPDVTPPTLSVDPLASPTQAGVAIPVTARATDASGVSNVTIYYRSNGIGSYNVLATAGAGPYTATIPAAAVVTGTLQVYAQATDTEGNVATSTTQTITVEPAPDLTAPTINLTAVPNGQAAGTAVTVTASITDDSGIASATLYHRLQGTSTFTTVPMTAAAGSTFTAVIPGIAVSAPAVEYYVRAVDGSASANAANVPAAAPTLVARFTVTVGDTAGPGIAHTPPALPILAGTSVSLSATLTDSTGVASAEVYWRTGSAGAFTTVAMANVGGTWTASIGPVAAPEFTYYIRAVDTLGNASTDPADAPTSTRQRTVTVPDTTGPTITHTPLPGGRAPGLSIAIEANVTDASGVSTVRVRYRTVGSTPFTSLDLANAGSGRYTGTIPGAAVVAPGFEYYLEATDTAAPSNLALLPSGAPATLYTVTTAVTAADLTPPTLTHTPIPGPLAAGVSLVVEASAADTSGIRDVTLSYRVVGDADWISAPMTLVGPTWRATIPARNIVSPGIEYYLTATDNAPAANRATLPASAPAVVYAVDVATPDTAGPTITVTRYTEPVPVGLDLPFTATVTDPSGVASVTLHWRQTGTATFAQLAMTPDGGDSFAATIPGSLVDEAGIEYWVSAVDASAAANTATAPASAPTTVYMVETFVAADTDAPVIVVTEVTSPQPADTDVAVVADVTDASDIVSVILYARAEAAADWAIVDMEPLEGDTFSAVIDATVVTEGTVYYYVLAEDAEGNVALEPLTAPTETFSFSVLPIEQIDTTPPTITHIPPAELVANADATIEALVADASGVNSVTVYYTSGSVTDAISVTAANESDDTWVAIIPASDVTGELLSYYIVADDLAVAGNVGTLPADAPASVFSVTLVQGGGDTGLDAGNDAGLDAGNDVGTDAGDTTSADVTPDAEADAGGDATVDGASNGDADSEPTGSGAGNSSGGGCSATTASPGTPVTLGLMLAAMLLVHRRRRVCRE